jgi:hypothetical protein
MLLEMLFNESLSAGGARTKYLMRAPVESANEGIAGCIGGKGRA